MIIVFHISLFQKKYLERVTRYCNKITQIISIIRLHTL